jgi:hypothetical protein
VKQPHLGLGHRVDDLALDAAARLPLGRQILADRQELRQLTGRAGLV